MPEVPLYDHFADDYDRFVDWKGRLAYELPFLLRRLREAGAQRVLDVACGTGHHSLALADAGYDVTGVDLSTHMIERARENARRRGVAARFEVAGFGELAGKLGEKYDALLCLGNSLPHALTADALREALADFRAVLRPAGILILQNRNFDQVLPTRDRFMPPQSHVEGDREWLFVRFYDFHDETITFNMMTLRREPAGWGSSVESTELRPIVQAELEEALPAAGFASLQLFGALAEEPFDAGQSGNLVVVARAA